MPLFNPPLRLDQVAAPTGAVDLNSQNLTRAGTITLLASGSDANPTLRLSPGIGQIDWGPGGATATDLSLFRSGIGAAKINGDLWMSGKIGFQGTVPQAKPSVTGSKGANAALASLLTALANYGLITDGSS